jgi:hypothetical protein
MRLTPESHTLLEQFYRYYWRDEKLALPWIDWDVGRAAQFVVRTSGVTAMTLGARVLLHRPAAQRDESGRWLIKSRLAAHETAHVLQYQRLGWSGFLLDYLGDYAREMRGAARWNAAAHFQSYESIKAEREAQAAEDAYIEWSGRSVEELIG